MINISRTRTTLGRQILIFNGSLIVITIIYYFLGGFDTEELSSLLTLLTAVSAIYLGTLFKYISGSIRESPEVDTADKKIPIGNLITWIIPIHFVLLAGIISAKAFTQISFQEMNIFLGLLEAVFGGYLGLVINQVFHPKNERENEN